MAQTFSTFALGEITTMVNAANANHEAYMARGGSSPYTGWELSEVRRKYALVNHVMTNGQRTAAFLVDEHLNVYRAKAYGVRGNFVSSVPLLTQRYLDAANNLREQK